MKIVYVKYSDPGQFRENPSEKIPTRYLRMVFSAAGLLIREDDELIVIGERASVEDNEKAAEKYGRDMLPAYRNITPIRKSDIISRKDIEI